MVRLLAAAEGTRKVLHLSNALAPDKCLGGSSTPREYGPRLNNNDKMMSESLHVEGPY